VYNRTLINKNNNSLVSMTLEMQAFHGVKEYKM